MEPSSSYSSIVQNYLSNSVGSQEMKKQLSQLPQEKLNGLLNYINALPEMQTDNRVKELRKCLITVIRAEEHAAPEEPKAKRARTESKAVPVPVADTTDFFSKMPSEIRHLIFSYFDLKELAKIAEVSKSFNKETAIALAKNGKFMEVFVIAAIVEKQLDRLDKFLDLLKNEPPFQDTLFDFHVLGGDFGFDSPERVDSFLKIHEKFPNARLLCYTLSESKFTDLCTQGVPTRKI